jgi:hypothetical protein
MPRHMSVRPMMCVGLAVVAVLAWCVGAAQAKDAFLDPYPMPKKPPVMKQEKSNPDHGRGISGFILPAPTPRTWIPREDSVLLARYYKPYWQAGEYDRNLSMLCRGGYFYEHRAGRWVIKYDDRQGQATLGVAAVGFNLTDMTGAGKRGDIYLFYQSGETRCNVYRWKDQWPPQPDLPP